MGCDVTVVELMANIMPVEDPEISGIARKALEKQGMKIITEAKVTKVDKGANSVKASVETKDGKTRIVAIYAKKARGMMADYILRNRIETPEGIQDFDMAGYKYAPSLSSSERWVFERPQPAPLGKK